MPSRWLSTTVPTDSADTPHEARSASRTSSAAPASGLVRGASSTSQGSTTTVSDGVLMTMALNAIGVSSTDGVNAGTAQAGIGTSVGRTKLALSTRHTSAAPTVQC